MITLILPTLQYAIQASYGKPIRRELARIATRAGRRREGMVVRSLGLEARQ